MRPFLPLIASLFLIAGCQQASLGSPATSAPPPAQVRLATWNLEHLAEADGTGCRPRTEADYAALREHVQQLNADVVAFQEVESLRAAQRVFPANEWTLVMSERPSTSEGSPCRGAEPLTIRRQDVGFAIRKGIPFRRNADLAGLGLGDPNLRWGVDITLDLPRPMRLLSVHLKSGCNAGRDARDEDCAVLFRQLPVLEGWIDARARSGQDFAVLGDWNRRTALPDDAFIAEVSDDNPPGGRLIMTNAGRRATCVQRYRDFIDHIAVGERAVARIVPGSFFEYTYGSVPEDQHPSDHCPSLITIR